MACICLCCYSNGNDIPSVLSQLDTGGSSPVDQNLGDPVPSPNDGSLAPNALTMPEVDGPAALLSGAPIEDQTAMIQPHPTDDPVSGLYGETCAARLAIALALSNNMIDLSGAKDVVANGDNVLRQFYQLLTSTSSFGTHSGNIYIDLSQTGATSLLIASWSKVFSDDGKVVIWNVSYNDSIGDEVVDAVVLHKTYHLNLAHTAVTDAGIAKMVNLIKINGIGDLRSINLEGCNVTPSGAATLRTAMREAAAAAESQDGQKRPLLGDSGVHFNARHGARGSLHRGSPRGGLQPGMVPAGTVADPLIPADLLPTNAGQGRGFSRQGRIQGGLQPVVIPEGTDADSSIPADLLPTNAGQGRGFSRQGRIQGGLQPGVIPAGTDADPLMPEGLLSTNAGQGRGFSRQGRIQGGLQPGMMPAETVADPEIDALLAEAVGQVASGTPDGQTGAAPGFGRQSRGGFANHGMPSVGGYPSSGRFTRGGQGIKEGPESQDDDVDALIQSLANN
ncbi:MAG: hypothetical protein LBJ77_02075 [Holosporales bacterium]|nr:hypothetical protein [Holosporales bacterium]